MKIWLDDLRTAPKDWVRTHNFEEMIDLLKTIKPEDVDVASLDHDLGGMSYNYCKICHDGKQLTYDQWHELFVHGCEHGPKTGMKVVEWMEKNNFWPRRVVIHSHNPQGAQRMFELASKYTEAYLAPYTGDEV